MKSLITFALLSLFVLSCGSEKSPALATPLSESENIKLLNKIFKDTKTQLPFVYHRFMEFSKDYVDSSDFSATEIESIFRHKTLTDTIKYELKAGDIQYLNTTSGNSQKSIIIKSITEAYNQNVINFSRPILIGNDRAIIFFKETILYYKENREGPISGSIWATIFIQRNGKWEILKIISIADMA